jgi:hypothetical protein
MNECEAIERFISAGIFSLFAVSLLVAVYFYGVKKGREQK